MFVLQLCNIGYLYFKEKLKNIDNCEDQEETPLVEWKQKLNDCGSKLEVFHLNLENFDRDIEDLHKIVLVRLEDVFDLVKENRFLVCDNFKFHGPNTRLGDFFECKKRGTETGFQIELKIPTTNQLSIIKFQELQHEFLDDINKNYVMVSTFNAAFALKSSIDNIAKKIIKTAEDDHRTTDYDETFIEKYDSKAVEENNNEVFSSSSTVASSIIILKKKPNRVTAETNSSKKRTNSLQLSPPAKKKKILEQNGIVSNKKNEKPTNDRLKLPHIEQDQCPEESTENGNSPDRKVSNNSMKLSGHLSKNKVNVEDGANSSGADDMSSISGASSNMAFEEYEFLDPNEAVEISHEKMFKKVCTLVTNAIFEQKEISKIVIEYIRIKKKDKGCINNDLVLMLHGICKFFFSFVLYLI